ncbi:unnamed protein product, partial [Prorocentrum cordatum]
ACSIEAEALFREIATPTVLKKSLSGESLDTAMSYIVDIVGKVIFDSIDGDVISLLNQFFEGTMGACKEKVSVLITMCPKLKDMVQLWRSHDNIHDWFQTRTLHVIGLLAEVPTASADAIELTGISEDQLPLSVELSDRITKARAFLEGTLVKASTADACLYDLEECTVHWINIIKTSHTVGQFKKKKKKNQSDLAQMERGIISELKGTSVSALRDSLDSELSEEHKRTNKDDLVELLAATELASKRAEEDELQSVWNERTKDFYAKLAPDMSSYRRLLYSPTHFVDSKLWKALSASSKVGRWMTEWTIKESSLRAAMGKLSSDGANLRKHVLFYRPNKLWPETAEIAEGGGAGGDLPGAAAAAATAATEAGGEIDATKSQESQPKVELGPELKLRLFGKVLPCPANQPPIAWKKCFKCADVGGIGLYVVPEPAMLDVTSDSCVHGWARRMFETSVEDENSYWLKQPSVRKSKGAGMELTEKDSTYLKPFDAPTATWERAWK